MKVTINWGVWQLHVLFATFIFDWGVLREVNHPIPAHLLCLFSPTRMQAHFQFFVIASR